MRLDAKDRRLGRIERPDPLGSDYERARQRHGDRLGLKTA